MYKFWALSLTIFFSCGTTTVNHRTPKADEPSVQDQISALKEQIAQLSLFASSYTSGVSNPFSECSVVTNSLEKKICQIAQTATATQQLEMKSQLAEMSKNFQVALFGEDCIDSVELGCPIVGSIAAKLAVDEAAIASNTASISDIQSSLTATSSALSALSGRVAALETRLNNFNGSGQTIESLIADMQSDIVTLEGQVADIQGIIGASRTLEVVTLCGDNATSGPIFEIVLMSGDKTSAYGRVKTGSNEGLGLFFSAGSTDTLFVTTLNSKSCRYKMYNNPTKTKIQACWVKTNRSATEAQIDAARTANTATCTSF